MGVQMGCLHVGKTLIPVMLTTIKTRSKDNNWKEHEKMRSICVRKRATRLKQFRNWAKEGKPKWILLPTFPKIEVIIFVLQISHDCSNGKRQEITKENLDMPSAAIGNGW